MPTGVCPFCLYDHCTLCKKRKRKDFDEFDVYVHWCSVLIVEGEMATRNLEKLASIDAQLRQLVPAKVSEDDKLVEYDALLLDRFLDILQDLHGEDLKETVCSSLFLCLLSNL